MLKQSLGYFRENWNGHQKRCRGFQKKSQVFIFWEMTHTFTIFPYPEYIKEWPNWTWSKKNCFASRTSASVIKLRKENWKNHRKRLQGWDFTRFVLCKAKNFFFWEMTPTFDNFPNWPTYQRVLWYQNPSKKVKKFPVAIFSVDLEVKISLIKFRIWQFWDWAGEGLPTVKSTFCN